MRFEAHRPGLLLATLALLFTQGCGYSFSGSSLPSHIRTVAVPSFGNESLDGLIADEVTQGAIEAFLDDNRLKVVREAKTDCVLEGRITGYERRVYSYTPAQEPEQYIVVVTLAVVMKDRVKNQDLWSNEAMKASATYEATPSSSEGVIDSEADARIEVIDKLMQDILAKTLEQW